ncbi:myosin heavy chain kinase b [Phtheirospermum japonicum]|uniref:Myosin heavy chain kinase b n=1 Tax=Phtheirospermum japonicum TaxID=374723 RepID=A0A830BVZ4_9LAMI|nr:myosin heavy chain kinase b [Phtheirospermum japonicum]
MDSSLNDGPPNPSFAIRFPRSVSTRNRRSTTPSCLPPRLSAATAASLSSTTRSRRRPRPVLPLRRLRQAKSDPAPTAAVSSVLKKDGQILCVAAANGLVYTGSQANVVRVWKLRGVHGVRPAEDGRRAWWWRCRFPTIGFMRRMRDCQIRVWRRFVGRGYQACQGGDGAGGREFCPQLYRPARSNEAFRANIITGDQHLRRHSVLSLPRQDRQSMAHLRLQMHRDHPGPPGARQRHRPRRRRRPLHRLRTTPPSGVWRRNFCSGGRPHSPHRHPPHQALARQGPWPSTHDGAVPVRRLHRRLRPLLAAGVVLRPDPVRPPRCRGTRTP